MTLGDKTIRSVLVSHADAWLRDALVKIQENRTLSRKLREKFSKSIRKKKTNKLAEERNVISRESTLPVCYFSRALSDSTWVSVRSAIIFGWCDLAWTTIELHRAREQRHDRRRKCSQFLEHSREYHFAEKRFAHSSESACVHVRCIVCTYSIACTHACLRRSNEKNWSIDWCDVRMSYAVFATRYNSCCYLSKRFKPSLCLHHLLARYYLSSLGHDVIRLLISGSRSFRDAMSTTIHNTWCCSQISVSRMRYALHLNLRAQIVRGHENIAQLRHVVPGFANSRAFGNTLRIMPTSEENESQLIEPDLCPTIFLFIPLFQNLRQYNFF